MCVQSAFLPPHLGLKSFALCVQNQGPDFRLLVTLVEELGSHTRHALGPLRAHFPLGKAVGLMTARSLLLRGEPFLCPQSQRRLWTQQLPPGARKPLLLVCGESLLMERRGNDAHDLFK